MDLPDLRPKYLGAHLPRVEDDLLLRGEGSYVADLRLPDMAEMVIVRSQFPHARIHVNLDATRRQSGVLLAVAGSDITDAQPLPDFVSSARPVRFSMLAQEKVRYVGSPIAAVIALNRYVAEDAAESAEVEYDELPIVASIEAALAADAPRLFDDWSDNRIVEAAGKDTEIADVFGAAWKVVGERYFIQRHAAVPIETRGCVAHFRRGKLTLWTSTQIPHWIRTLIPHVLPISERDIRVVAPDVGGAFGCKWHLYAEELLACWVSMRLGRPVRFIEDRAEHMVATNHARDMTFDLEAAIDRDGAIQGIRGTIFQDVGSGEIFPVSFGSSFTARGILTGPYRIPRSKIDVVGVVTNKTPAGAYRGFGTPEAQFAMERLIDRCSIEADVDPMDLRRRMILRPEDLPYTTSSGAIIDSGSHLAAFDRVQEQGKAALERTRRLYATNPEIRIGLGITNFVEGTGAGGFGDTSLWGSHDAVSIRLDPDGGVSVSSGVTTTGQGVQTMLATLAADALAVPLEQVRVIVGDTDATPYGLGGWASRSTGVATGAMLKVTSIVRNKAVRIAAHLLEAAPEDIVLEDGAFRVAGSEATFVTWRDVATAAYVRTMDLPPDMEPGLEGTSMYSAPGIDHEPSDDGRMNASPTYANASVAAVVKVDIETGFVSPVEYLAIHDCGRLLNPTIVDGQIEGGIAQGIGGTLLEHLVYSPDAQPLATTFMDYLLPSAAETPHMTVMHLESPAPNMPLGVKGAGEAGVVGVSSAIAQAVENALAEFGIGHLTETPITPSAVCRLVQNETQRSES